MSSFSVSFQGKTLPIDLPLTTTTLAELGQRLQELTDVAVAGQKLIYKGKRAIAPPTCTLDQAGIKPGTKVMLLGTTSQALDAFKEEEADAERVQAILAKRKTAPPSKVSRWNNASEKRH
jgi:hypothetical protein